MNIHVFVVDSTTFKLHLDYMFAGTGAKDKTSPFLTSAEVNYHNSTERNLVGMIADISRIRPGDKIIFYLQSTQNNQGLFFGVFKAESLGFFDENDNNNYLVSELGKGLAFRVKIAPDCVYPLGITEHDYLDDLTGKSAPHQLCWSMIYRKLKGNRGCTMITQYEFDDLKAKLEVKNNGQTLNNTRFSFDSREVKISNVDQANPYTGRECILDIQPRLLYKAHRGNAFETHLQAFIMQKFDSPILKDKILSLDNGSVWIGNEVSCGVGMQRIDTMIIEENETEIHLKIVELKDEEPYDYIIDEQLPWYLKWSSQYIIPNILSYGKKVIVHPCILAKRTDNQRIIDRIRTQELVSLNIENVEVICDSTITPNTLLIGLTFGFTKILYKNCFK